MEALVTTARLEIAAGHFGQPLLLLACDLDLCPRAARLVRRIKVTVFSRAVRGGFRLVSVFRGRLQFQALHSQLLDAIRQVVRAVLDLRPEIVAPERVLAYGPLQSSQPEVERWQSSLPVRHVMALQMVGKQTGHRNKPDGRL